jgi:acetyl-CoA C-acetyltransferase
MPAFPDVVIASVARTAFGKFGGALAEVSAAKLAASAIDATLQRAGVGAKLVEGLYVGSGLNGSAAFTLARQAVFYSQLLETTPSALIDRACCSGMSAIALGWRDIRLGLADAVICGGTENLSAMPLFMPRAKKRSVGSVILYDPLTLRSEAVEEPIARYTAAEALAVGVDRAEQDAWALRSHVNYFTAAERGYFNFERVPVEVPQSDGSNSLLVEDESPRRDTSMAKLAALRPVYGSATITAGNAPGLNDGAAFIMLVSGKFCLSHGLTPIAQVLDCVQVAGNKTSGSYTPAAAITKLLTRSNMQPSQLNRIEINEAFAATALVSTLKLAEGDKQMAARLRAITNMQGGAVAIGHPLGASGARIAVTLVNALRERGGGIGTAAICGGYGQGEALLLEAS